MKKTLLLCSLLLIASAAHSSVVQHGQIFETVIPDGTVGFETILPNTSANNYLVAPNATVSTGQAKIQGMYLSDGATFTSTYGSIPTFKYLYIGANTTLNLPSGYDIIQEGGWVDVNDRTLSNLGLGWGGSKNVTFYLNNFGYMDTRENNNALPISNTISLTAMLSPISSDLYTYQNYSDGLTLVTRTVWDGNLVADANAYNVLLDGYTKVDGLQNIGSIDDKNYFVTITGGKNGSIKVSYLTNATIPEPSSATLGLLGLASLLFKRKRR